MLPADLEQVVTELVDAIVVAGSATAYIPASLLIAEIAACRGCVAIPMFGHRVLGKLATFHCWATIDGAPVNVGRVMSGRLRSIANQFPPPILIPGFDLPEGVARVDNETKVEREELDRGTRIARIFDQHGLDSVWNLNDMWTGNGELGRTSVAPMGIDYVDQDQETHRLFVALRGMFATLTHCCVCGRRAATRCGKCRAEAYCSKGCQTSRWRECHKAHCAAIVIRINTNRKESHLAEVESDIIGLDGASADGISSDGKNN